VSLILDGQVALISGGGTGIGEAIARAFARAGATVAISGRRRDVLEAAANGLEKETGGCVLAIAGDVANRADCERMVAETVSRFGGLDILVNNAGVSRGGPIGSMGEEAVHEVVDVDLKGPVFLTQAALPHLTKSGETRRASILNISSSVTVHPVPNYSVYSAAKAGLDMLTRCWAIELAPARIRVNAHAGVRVDAAERGDRDPPRAVRQAHAARAHRHARGRGEAGALSLEPGERVDDRGGDSARRRVESRLRGVRT
jgi:NAD(P)-dependent dehydrogenase (short-subunit alcohol dehydrogenase family)